MKALYIVLSLLAIGLFSSYKASEACEYAGSNIGYVKTQTKLALENNNLNKAKFLTYKAINAIYKLKGQLDECGCEQAVINLEESQYHLIKATKASSIEGARILLAEAYNTTINSLEAIERHHLHENPDMEDEIAIDTIESQEKIDLPVFHLNHDALQIKIDDSLIPFETSLQQIVDSVNCKDARVFAERIFQLCEQELLKSDLSEGKKYYNLKTQEITADALRQLGDCGSANSK